TASLNFEVIGYASSSKLFGSGLSACSGTSFLQWATTGLFSCNPAPSGSSGSTNLTVKDFPGGTRLTGRASLSFDASAFNIAASGSTDVRVSLDYSNGPASRSIAQTISGAWTFTAATSHSAPFELSSTASISGKVTVKPTLNTDVDATGMLSIAGAVTKNDSNTRTFSGLQIKPTFNTGGSNLNLTFHVLSIDTTNTAITGIGTSLINAAYAGTTQMNVDVNGNLGLTAGAKIYPLVGDSTAAIKFARAGPGNNVVVIDTTNSFVGIGINPSPNTALDVMGNIAASTSGNVDFILHSSTTTGDVNTDARFLLRTGSISERFDVINGSGTKLMTIASAGSVGVGTIAPAKRLHVALTTLDTDVLRLQDSNGTCDHNPGSGSEVVTCSSDARLKTDIRDSAPILDYLNGLRIRDYTVIAGGQATGVIAQEILEKYPDLVVMGEDGYYKVAGVSSWKLIKGIQELSQQVNSLSALIASKSGENDLTNDGGVFGYIISKFQQTLGIVFENSLIKVTELITDRFTTKKLCLDDVCIEKDQLKTLLEKEGILIPTPLPMLSPSPESSPEETPEISPESSPEPPLEASPSSEPISTS
ncbi:tail fiber domain-containing protein, partial [Candidatus Parcubacteria bacterium]|nr:tail fiber domain-containing protein [Candidatus Parcubacteria bacterium]